MPKILINEKDRTSPGSPDSYANFAVLIAGLAKTKLTLEEAEAGLSIQAWEDKRTAAKDSNGVYEFSSAEAFKNTIGLVAPEVPLDEDEDEEKVEKVINYHYGNQMAYELLNMGYTVIYKVVEADKLNLLGTEIFWECFKDKSSYDFRFVTHGLLESTEFSDKKARTEYESKIERLDDVKDAIAALRNIEQEYPLVKDVKVAEGETDPNTEITKARNDAYVSIYAKYPGFKKGNTTYDTFQKAYEALIGASTKKGEEATLEEDIESLVGGRVTTTLINDANGCIANLAKYVAVDGGKELPGRGDCVALIEADEKTYVSATGVQTNPEVKIIKAINEMTGINADNGKFSALTVPSVHYIMADNEIFGKNKKFPGAFHYLACFMNSLKLGFAEWYAAAGYTRGVASFIVDHTSVKLGEIAINALEPRNYEDPQSDYPKFACNVIANFRGSYYLWGNRTAHPLGKKGSLDTGDLVASSFLNIRQLCCTIKKQLYVACRTFTFDPNSDTLWVNFCNAIRPTLEAMKADQGIRDYKILKVFTDKKATLKAKIRIIPIEAVEDFDLEVSLEDSFGETTAVVTE